MIASGSFVKLTPLKRHNSLSKFDSSKAFNSTSKNRHFLRKIANGGNNLLKSHLRSSIHPDSNPQKNKSIDLDPLLAQGVASSTLKQYKHGIKSNKSVKRGIATSLKNSISKNSFEISFKANQIDSLNSIISPNYKKGKLKMKNRKYHINSILDDESEQWNLYKDKNLNYEKSGPLQDGNCFSINNQIIKRNHNKSPYPLKSTKHSNNVQMKNVTFDSLRKFEYKGRKNSYEIKKKSAEDGIGDISKISFNSKSKNLTFQIPEFLAENRKPKNGNLTTKILKEMVNKDVLYDVRKKNYGCSSSFVHNSAHYYGLQYIRRRKMNINLQGHLNSWVGSSETENQIRELKSIVSKKRDQEVLGYKSPSKAIKLFLSANKSNNKSILEIENHRDVKLIRDCNEPLKNQSYTKKKQDASKIESKKVKNQLSNSTGSTGDLLTINNLNRSLENPSGKALRKYFASRGDRVINDSINLKNYSPKRRRSTKKIVLRSLYRIKDEYPKKYSKTKENARNITIKSKINIKNELKGWKIDHQEKYGDSEFMDFVSDLK